MKHRWNIGDKCEFIGTTRLGTIYSCLLYREELMDNDGYLQRCEKCKKED